MSVIEAWPFLVSRNRKFGYRTVVAPQFLYDQNLSGLLAETAGGDVTDQGYANYYEITGSTVGDIILIFRVVRAEEHYVGGKGNEVLLDQNGRPIDLVEGIVLREKARDVKVTDGDLQQAHEQIEKAYQEFWNSTTSLPTVKPSTPIYLEMDDSPHEWIILKKLTPFSIPPSGKQEQRLNEGDNHYKTEHYAEALTAYEQAIRLDPGNASAYNSKGNVLYALERSKEASEAYDQAMRFDPQAIFVYINKGNTLYYKLQSYEEALGVYMQASTLDPDDARISNAKGNALDALERYEEALLAYDHALSLSLKPYKETLIAYERNIRLDSSLIYINKGQTLYKLKRYEEALAAYEQASRLNPHYAKDYNDLKFRLKGTT